MMTYGNPAKSLALARERLTPEQWQRFEREFDDFCVVQGLEYNGLVLDWARWAFFQGRQHKEAVSAAKVSYDDPLLVELFYAAQHSITHFRLKARDIIYKAQRDRTANQRVADAKYTRLALAMMDDEQAEQSLERWMGRGE